MKVAERINKYGVGVCSNAELLQAAGGKKENVETMEDLYNIIDSLTPQNQTRIKAMVELMFRLHTTKKPEVMHGPEDVYKYSASYFRGLSKEHFCIMLLNIKNGIIGMETISIGSLSASVVHPREVFEAACRKHAAAIILLHNHPSGDPSPSREDINVTQRLVKAGKIMDIPVLDHIIIGDNRFVSIKEKGML